MGTAPSPPRPRRLPAPPQAPAARPRCRQHSPPPAPAEDDLIGGVAAAMALVKAHRMHGHLAARIDPLGSAPVGDPALDPLRLEPKLTLELQARIPASILRVHVEGDTLAEALPHLKETYCGAMGYELEHIADHEQRVWLRKAIESWRFRTPLAPDEQKRLYARLCEVEGMERYLRRAFLGQKQFSLEGLDVLIPMLDESLELAAEAGAREVVIGMAHRGRLERPRLHDRPSLRADRIREFEGERASRGRRRETPRAAPATASTTSAPKASEQPRTAARSPTSRSPPTRAIWRPSTPLSRVQRAPSRPTAPRASARDDPSAAMPVLASRRRRVQP